MSISIQGNMKVKDIVIQWPHADQVFKQYKIDFCCGGDRPLSEAIEEKNLDEAVILKQLEEVKKEEDARKNEGETDWMNASYTKIIDHVTRHHHGFLLKELPDLSFYVTKIFRVHGEDHANLATVHRVFHELKTDLEQHLMKEEQQIFPAMKAYESEGGHDRWKAATDAINELEDEHETAGDLLKQLREATNDYAVPEGSCTTFQMTYKRLEELESDMFKHVHLENNILFPRIQDEA
ncbi:iron-sulfur cluster repair di-iron protein [Texcoconibacillus texcoconensis]|uniref:Regulator of cell morphogenesis and NO signaling n=1 Tax=Texcoconibacillus texcoconensis TaxID=1095777 RepID=A0A840QT05_9BACI|nr:iron-sulfur cluster repair di-iron protein [Texcoconibacillus texcoconensis]MBB5174494.1 regulator of cell morphogenesis and NO signaling [Texcoconibacillus texcoconensis]